jgi:SET domain-containing protein
MIECYYKTQVHNSTIHGYGRFAVEPIEEGKLVLRIQGNIYKNENNSFVNHSSNNNVDWDGSNGWISNRLIDVGEELTMNYNQWVDISHLGWNT